MKASGIGLVSLGVLSLLGSLLWPWLLPKSVWTDEEAEQYAAAAGEYHVLTFKHSNSTDDEDLRAVAAARKHYEKRRASLDRAVALQDRGAAVFRWCGIACAIVGSVLLIVNSQQAND